MDVLCGVLKVIFGFFTFFNANSGKIDSSNDVALMMVKTMMTKTKTMMTMTKAMMLMTKAMMTMTETMMTIPAMLECETIPTCLTAHCFTSRHMLKAATLAKMTIVRMSIGLYLQES